MESQTKEITTTNTQVAQQNQLAKYPIAHSLPENLIKELPQTTIAKISQLTLKQCSDTERLQFAHQVLEFINPKFEDKAEAQYSQKILVDFASKCQLTANEFMVALEMVSKRELVIDGEPVKIFREIDRLKLGEIERAYTDFIRNDKRHELGLKKINEYLNPPKEPTEAEKRQEWIEHLRKHHGEYQQTGKIKTAFLYYDKINREYEMIRLEFVENFFKNYRAEEPQKISGGGLMPFKVVKNDAFTCFKEAYVYAFLRKIEASKMTEEEWVNHWINRFVDKN